MEGDRGRSALGVGSCKHGIVVRDDTCNKLNMLKLCTFNEDWTATEYTLS